MVVFPPPIVIFFRSRTFSGETSLFKLAEEMKEKQQDVTAPRRTSVTFPSFSCRDDRTVGPSLQLERGGEEEEEEGFSFFPSYCSMFSNLQRSVDSLSEI